MQEEIRSFINQYGITFETLIHCVNYWNGLSDKQKAEAIDLYQSGEIHEWVKP